MLDELDTRDQAAIEEVFARVQRGEMSLSPVRKVLGDNGLSIGTDTLRKHIFDECVCHSGTFQSDPSMPDALKIELLHPDGSAVLLRELGAEAMAALGISSQAGDRPLIMEVEAQISKAGNTYYDFWQNALPLPDQLDTRIKVDGNEVRFGPAHNSRRGNPTRRGTLRMDVAGVPCDVDTYLTVSPKPMYLKVVVRKARGPKPSADIPAGEIAPRGGRISLPGL